MAYKYREPFEIVDDKGTLYMETRTYKNRQRELMKAKLELDKKLLKKLEEIENK